MKYLAHSAKDNVPAQEYKEHIENVMILVERYLEEMGPFIVKDKDLFSSIAFESAREHDLGKLNRKNQEVLNGCNIVKSLPVHHQDAGAAFYLQHSVPHIFSAALIQAHHKGFLNFIDEQTRGNLIFRDKDAYDIVNVELPELLKIHSDLISKAVPICETESLSNVEGDRAVLLRMSLSCLADADHTDTARHYRKYPKQSKIVELKAGERLARLNQFIEEKETISDRDTLRREMYESCRDVEIGGGINSCDSPVGSGKTTAVMAHLLKQAQNRGLRRIFVILPTTNIIDQSVGTYRKALVLPDEDPEEVVAAIHHRAEFESSELRHLTALWQAPIIVTTAVAFFETLASDTPAVLRRLHELPGSAVFVDEVHAALPVKLLPVAWRWMNVLADDWSCYWVLASGSLTRFWDILEISGESRGNVREIVNPEIRKELIKYEYNRIVYEQDLDPKSSDELVEWVTEKEGPRLLILNTVQSAAYIAHKMRLKFGRECVEHLSTALCPEDREATLERIQFRLKNKVDQDWTLVATSCVEIGLDFSFHNRFREISSLLSLIQAAGRINRNGEFENSVIWSFCLKNEKMLSKNPEMENSAKILDKYLKEKQEKKLEISPALSTQAIQDEIRLYGMDKQAAYILKQERLENFKNVEAEFKVIDKDSKLVIVDPELAEQIQNKFVDWNLVQKKSIRIDSRRLEKLGIHKIGENLYKWTLDYDSFLGYMAGIINIGQQKP